MIARDDHFEGTFTSRGTVVVMGSVKGRIEAVRVRIEDGATVDADVIVDEAIVAGEFTGNLTCRERLEAHASGRINGRVETYRLMLHEGASVEGEMHMLAEAPRDASTTIRGSAPLRGETGRVQARPERSRRANVAVSAAGSTAATSAAKSSAARQRPPSARRSAAPPRPGRGCGRRGAGRARGPTGVDARRTHGRGHVRPDVDAAAPGPTPAEPRRGAARSPRPCAWRRSSWRLAP